MYTSSEKTSRDYKFNASPTIDVTGVKKAYITYKCTRYIDRLKFCIGSSEYTMDTSTSWTNTTITCTGSGTATIGFSYRHETRPSYGEDDLYINSLILEF